MSLKTISPQRHRGKSAGNVMAVHPLNNRKQHINQLMLWFSPCLCVSEETTSHSTKAGKNASQVAGYVVEVLR
jgi:hypothetical protein